MRTVRPRTLALLAALGLTLAPTVAGAADEPGSGFANYKLLANAPGLGLGPLYTDVSLTVPEVTSSLTTGGVGAGLASLAWPGAVGGNAGDAALVLFPQLPPEARLLNSPVRAEARTGGERRALNSTVPGTVMAASAAGDEVTATASFASSQLPLVRAEGISSSSKVGFEGASKAVATARTALQDLVLADGAIRIGSVVSEATATSDGTKASAKGRTTVSGMTVAGIPVTVDENGVSVASQGLPVALPTEPLNDAVEALGLQVALTEPRTVTSGGSVRHDAGALVLVLSQGGTDYSLTVGRTSVSVEAAAGGDDALEELPPPDAAPAGPAPLVPDSAPAVPAATDGGGAGVAPVVDDAPLEAAPALPAGDGVAVAAPPVAAPAGGGLATFVPVSFALSGGVPAVLALLGLAATGLLAAGLRRLPDRVLALPSVVCDERSL